MKEQNIKSSVNKIIKDFGIRFDGWETTKKAARYIKKQLLESGLSVEMQKYNCPDWKVFDSFLKAGRTTLEMIVNPFSPSCEVKAFAVPVCSIKQLEKANLTDKICILYGELTKEPIVPVNCPLYNFERDKKINQLIIKKKPEAIICVSPNKKEITHIIEDPEISLPSVTISGHTALKLFEKLNDEIELKINAEKKESHSYNVIGKTDRGLDKLIVVCAHYDTKYLTTGAVDNTAGLCVMMEIANRLDFSEYNADFQFVAFGSHEATLHGSAEYLSRYEKDFERILTVINFDAVGQKLGTNTISVMSNSDEYKSELEKFVKRYDDIVWVNPWIQSDHSIFVMKGVPAVAMTNLGIMDFFHTEDDVVDWLDEDKLHSVIELGIEVINQIVDKDVSWTRPK